SIASHRMTAPGCEDTELIVRLFSSTGMVAVHGLLMPVECEVVTDRDSNRPQSRQLIEKTGIAREFCSRGSRRSETAKGIEPYNRRLEKHLN
ncbi:MAG TPA: hypothetical protein VFT30_10775, partial [Nitrospira sp.]|nr:hypothetical protein [Nitrospira sp.]